jgi:radical SAM protein with 4Fe4S-binding SPASM domain
MNPPIVKGIPLPEFNLWKRIRNKRVLTNFDFEITDRCNNNCRHCYINVPAGDSVAKKKELSADEIERMAGEAASLGALWCTLTGGEPLLREDFFDIYLRLKKRGLLLSLFTNATLITNEHIRFFKKYPPRDIEVTVYGATLETYEKVTRRKGAFGAFARGLDLLLKHKIPVRLKAMALRSNIHEMQEIIRFCQERTKDFFRFDPFLHLRFDGDPKRNKEIISERLSPSEIVDLERSDPARFRGLLENCERLIVQSYSKKTCRHLFYCGAGNSGFAMSSQGIFRLCSSLWHPDCIYDLKTGTLREAWLNFVPRVRKKESDRKQFVKKCLVCPIINLCLWCPAHAHLETGGIDIPVDYFCQVAQARAEALRKAAA